MRKKFDKEFKRKAVELSYARGNASEIADELGIDRALLYRWRKEFSQYKDNRFPGHGTPKMTDLERENEFTKTKYNVFENSIQEATNTPLITKYYHSHTDKQLAQQCIECTIKKICGGGHLAHRYSKENGFDNPSVYCLEIFKLVMHIQNRLIEDIVKPSSLDIPIEKLTLQDHPLYNYAHE